MARADDSPQRLAGEADKHAICHRGAAAEMRPHARGSACAERASLGTQPRKRTSGERTGVQERSSQDTETQKG
eukprot:4316263-Pleurochrysis_carterae.AAC.1